MSNSERRAVGDMKQGLTGARPKLSILPRVGLTYGTRGCEYGADKYARGNYHGPPPATVTPAERVLGYVDAALRHLTAISDAANHALGTGGDLAAALALPDDEASGGFPASGLPHFAHALASLLIGVSVAADDGLLPADPGQPLRAGAQVELPQKNDPAAERQRVADLAAARVREPGVYDVAEAPTDPHAALRAEIAAAGLPPAPDEALEGRKLVKGRPGGWYTAADWSPEIWSCGSAWTDSYGGTLPDCYYLVPQDWT